ncbi:MAG: flagellar protein FliT [Gammaproteobacteria bacterium]|nr:flagellar protein FliT [Gammaproteobacteria bacterium]
MMSSDNASLLVSALQLSEEMLRAAENDQWDDVISKEQERRALIEQAFNQKNNNSVALPDMIDCIKKILQLDRGLIDRGSVVKKEASDNIIALQKNVQVSNAYRSNAY